MHLYIRYTGIFFLAVLFGFLSFFAISNHYAYTQTLYELKKTQVALLRAPALVYGKVVAINPTERSITLGLNDKQLTYRVTDDAYIARQELLGNGQTYNALSEPVPSLLSDIPNGTRVAMFAYRSDTGELLAGVVLFGNPL